MFSTLSILALLAVAANGASVPQPEGSYNPDPSDTSDSPYQGPYPNFTLPPIQPLPNKYCGTTWEDANSVRAGEVKIPCPNDTNDECPEELLCFKDIKNIFQVPVPNVYDDPNFDANVTVKVYETCLDPNHVALTFDDGPNNSSTVKILDILEKHEVNATFFVLGNMVVKHPEVLQRIVNSGHMIGAHTYSHPNLTTCDDDTIVKEMIDVEMAIKNALPTYDLKNLTYMRPPYGAADQRVQEILGVLGYRYVIKWGLDSNDWNETAQTPADITEKWTLYEDNECGNGNWYCSFNSSDTGVIILHHDIYETTANVLESLIVNFKQQFPNKTFVHVDKCIGQPDNVIVPKSQ